MFQSQLMKQAEKQKRFIDDVAIKERKISDHVNLNYDKDVFLHEHDRYQQYRNMEHSQTLKVMQAQKSELEKRREEQKQMKQVEILQRQEYERNLQEQRLM